MSLVVYCPNPSCASPNEYTLRKPVLCGFCGSPLSSVSLANKKPLQAPVAPAKATIPSSPAPIIDEKQENIEEIPNIDQLNFKIEVFGGGNKVSFDDLAHQKKTGFNRPQVKKVNVKKEIADFQVEAGLNRETPRIAKES